MWVANGVIGIYWLLEVLRDEFFSPAIQERFRLLNLIPHWQWRTWLLLILGVLLMSLLEGSYRVMESLKAGTISEINGVRKEIVAAKETIDRLQFRLMDKAPKVLAEVVAVSTYPGFPANAPGFSLTNIGEMAAMSVQIQDISNETFLCRFEIVTQLLKGYPVSRAVSVEQNGVISPMLKHDLNRMLKAGRPDDLKIETRLFPLRIIYSDIEGKQHFETVYEMIYNYFTANVELRFIRYGIYEQVPVDKIG